MDKEKFSGKEFGGYGKKYHQLKKHKLYSELVVGEKVLDIGFAEVPNPFLKNPIGIDVQKIDRPKNYKDVYRVNMNKEKFPFADNCFDTAIAGEVVEHVENPSFFLREINRTLKPNGKFIVSTPHGCYYWEIIRNLFFSKIQSIDVGEHLSNWNILDFERLLNKNGFKVIKKYGSILVIRVPFGKGRIKIPVRRFPKLSWVVVYECVKEKKADSRIYTRKKSNPKNVYYGALTPEVIKIENK